MWFDETRILLGSELRITFECNNEFDGDRLLLTCWKKISQFEKRYSRFLLGNVLEDINTRVGEWQTVDDETFEHLNRVRVLEEKYPFGFSLAVKGALERMGYDAHYSFVGKGIEAGDGETRDFLLRDHGEVFIFQPLEFGGFGKGYALDMVVQILDDECHNMCLDFGGDLYARGVNQEGKKWVMVIESPFKDDEVIGTIVLDGMFLATSGTRKRRWGANNEYHHLIDPIKGTSANYWAGVSVLSSSGMEADFLATALFCTDADGIDMASESLSDSHFLLIDSGGKIYQHDFSAVLFQNCLI